jgi:Domain of unknown function (DUF6249)
VTEDMVFALIPIAAITMGLGTAMLWTWLDYRKKRDFFQLHHAERMAAIEKGIDLPPLPPEFFADYQRRRRAPEDSLRHGLVWLLVGIAVTVALSLTYRGQWGWGLVPLAVGIANLLFYWISQRAGTPPTANNPGPES